MFYIIDYMEYFKTKDFNTSIVHTIDDVDELEFFIEDNADNLLKKYNYTNTFYTKDFKIYYVTNDKKCILPYIKLYSIKDNKTDEIFYTTNLHKLAKKIDITTGVLIKSKGYDIYLNGKIRTYKNFSFKYDYPTHHFDNHYDCIVVEIDIKLMLKKFRLIKYGYVEMFDINIIKMNDELKELKKILINNKIDTYTFKFYTLYKNKVLFGNINNRNNYKIVRTIFNGKYSIYKSKDSFKAYVALTDFNVDFLYVMFKRHNYYSLKKIHCVIIDKEINSIFISREKAINKLEELSGNIYDTYEHYIIGMFDYYNKIKDNNDKLELLLKTYFNFYLEGI